MEKLSGAEMVVRSLQDQGVKHIFGYPGGSVLDIYDALFDNSDIEHVLVRHEQAAVHMADGYARSTGEVGTVLVTSGPGATNTITGIATAYMDSIPLVILSGQVATSLIGDDAFQETDMVGVSRPVVKHSFLVKNAADIPTIIKKAYYIASTGRPGPVVVDLPKDVQNPQNKFPYQYPKSISLRSYNPTVKGHPRQVKKALRALLKAKRPVLYIGGGAILANASEAVRDLAHQINLPVTSTLMGLGAFAGDDPQFLGMLGMHGTYEANLAMHHSDLIFAIGARFDDRVTNNVTKFCPDATVIHIDIDPTSISKTIAADIPIVGTVDAVLAQMQELMASQELPEAENLASWWQQIEQWRARKCLEYTTKDGVIKPQQVIEALYRATDGDAYVASDVGQHQMFTALYYPFSKPRRWINSGGLGTMGFGLPAAIGVKFAHPEATVVCVTGDGSIQMNIQELSTCMQYHIPVIIVSLNNRSLGMVKQWQKMFYGGRQSQSYMESVPDFVKLAQAYGHLGIQVNSPDQLDEAFKWALSNRDRVVFMDIMVDPDEHVYPMQIKTGTMQDMWLSKTERT
ncbi:acetolactate synthase 3 large subunit [Celerinatantimonas diazotrophica]|uniref:Acetolactate synthase n=1 Tax=Celerinatantimonas diazotrophica TaxID=412034 RepID=A0A4R1J8K4_9GAMM|nr:acetolactate synthase 3 large subunit [Celerinatantimonas diazotrophica]TCK46876.1 acetolactate synthase large subunit [Celerinatantimonas diazotrophica]CAG9295643.1 Acetolactate synthase isozyme 3 large subunit [Celerinatantimonas diazotrophica]